MQRLHTGLLLLALILAGAAPAHALSFQDRVEAQRAIERVYHSHRIGAPPFEEVVTQEILENRVRRQLHDSAWLERDWGVLLTNRDLDDELDRVLQRTSSPARLSQLFHALGNDGELIRECLLRPVLIKRLLRERRTPHAEPPLRPRRTLRRSISPREILELGDRVCRAPQHDGGPEVTASMRDPLDFSGLRHTAESPVVGPGGTFEEIWLPMTNVGAPSARILHTAVWTGSEMIVWGGRDPSYVNLNTGGRYDPVLDSWSPTSTFGAPSRREFHTAVWTGREMVVWGGSNPRDSAIYNDGGRYDPVSDAWSPTTQMDAPELRWGHLAVWTGSEMLVWGGNNGFCPLEFYRRPGGRYDPATDSWSSLAAGPKDRQDGSGVWTGSELLIWGGYQMFNDAGVLCWAPLLSRGAAYDPELDQWSYIDDTTDPSGRSSHTGVWTGDSMIVWGGCGQGPCNLTTGGVYHRDSDTWVSMAPPTEMTGSSNGVWTGNELILWGGEGRGTVMLNTGERYDPVTNTWAPISSNGAPEGRTLHSAVWTGDSMIVWGGLVDYYTYLSSGGRYVVLTDTTPPEITVELTPSVLWPPNHSMVGIQATVTATDESGDPTVVLTSITSNEEDDAPGDGDGNHPNDIQDAELETADFAFSLRAERAGTGSGRLYTVTYTATDLAGNQASASATVVVPHDQLGGESCGE